MKRLPLAIIVLVAVVAFAAADYFINAPLSELPDIISEFTADTQVFDSSANITQMLIDSNTAEFDYIIAKRDRAKQIFEKFDISSLENVVIFKNVLDKKEGQGSGDRIIIYEIQGAPNQGQLTYLSLKTKVIDQMTGMGAINEVSGYGYNSFFYNDINNQNTGFLLTQIKDNLFGFQYNKGGDGKNFETIKLMIETLKHLNLLT